MCIYAGHELLELHAFNVSFPIKDMTAGTVLTALVKYMADNCPSGANIKLIQDV
jgi:hypothetical protein